MRPIRPGDRGPAVEDIQRRLLALGYDLGITGVDGVFLGRTLEAVREFQSEYDLDKDGLVGDATWAALVDATFELGDRMLYLRLPHFHGRDVRELQEALNVLGFAPGQIDGIFGAFTERSVREFQRSIGHPADGIVGLETVGALRNLRHMWQGKQAVAHSGARSAPARAAEVLARVSIMVKGADETGGRVAERVVNLAHATTKDACTELLEPDASPPKDATVVVELAASGTLPAVPGRPIVHMGEPDDESVTVRLLTAFASAGPGCREIVIELPEAVLRDERAGQRAAVLVLDALCAAFD